MAKYRVLVKSYINNSIAEEGEVVEYDGKPGSNLELIEDEQPAAQKAKGSKKAASPSSDEPAAQGE